MKIKKLVFILLAVLILILAIVVVLLGSNDSSQNKTPVDQNSVFNYNEAIKNEVGIDGGILKNSDESIIAIIPPLKKKIEISLSFKESDFKIVSGTRSPITINISPDINIVDFQPIKIRIKYDSGRGLPVPYFIDSEDKLHLVDIGEINEKDGYFEIFTFHGGNYSWIYEK